MCSFNRIPFNLCGNEMVGLGFPFYCLMYGIKIANKKMCDRNKLFIENSLISSVYIIKQSVCFHIKKEIISGNQ